MRREGQEQLRVIPTVLSKKPCLTSSSSLTNTRKISGSYGKRSHWWKSNYSI
jgi:hypothetical protein